MEALCTPDLETAGRTLYGDHRVSQAPPDIEPWRVGTDPRRHRVGRSWGVSSVGCMQRTAAFGGSGANRSRVPTL